MIEREDEQRNLMFIELEEVSKCGCALDKPIRNLCGLYLCSIFIFKKEDTYLVLFTYTLDTSLNHKTIDEDF